MTLIKENADLTYKNAYLETQISDLKSLISELEETIENLESEIEENEEKTTLSENPINQLLAEARPLVQPLLAGIITRFLTPQNGFPTPPNNEVQTEINFDERPGKN
jgi:TolA-binding protein